MVEKRQKLRGTTSQLNAIVGLDGLLTVDRSRNDLRLFDGVLFGGYRIPNYNAVAADFVAKVRKINTGNGITGGGSLGGDLTLGLTGQALSVHNWNQVGLMWRTGANAYTPVIQGDGLQFVPGTPNTLAVNSTVVRTTRTLTAGDGLSGGGDLSANRSFAVNSTVVRTTRTLTAGDGLSGGGTLAADLAFAVNSTVVRTTCTLNTTSPLTGGGDLSANRTLAINMAALTTTLTDTYNFGTSLSIYTDSKLSASKYYSNDGIMGFTLSTVNVASSLTTITAGNGLTGGGTLGANMTISLGTPGTLSHNTTNTASSISHTHELDSTGISIAYSKATANAVGQLAFARNPLAVDYGDVVVGPSLTRSDANNNSYGSALSGPGTYWQCLGKGAAGVATLYRRIT